MNEQLFDAMLRTALEEALEEDCREAPAEQKHTGHTSLRQRRRMRRMLADPWGYERRSRAAKQMEAQQKMQVKTPVRHLRWPVLAAAVLLLTVSVTGYALRGGAFFQSFFEKSPWAEDYAGTADTEQLTELGGTGIGAVAEDEHLRLELLDAISEGENGDGEGYGAVGKIRHRAPCLFEYRGQLFRFRLQQRFMDIPGGRSQP